MHCARVQSKLARPDSTAGSPNGLAFLHDRARRGSNFRFRYSESNLFFLNLLPLTHPRIFPNLRVESLPVSKRLSAAAYINTVWSVKCTLLVQYKMSHHFSASSSAVVNFVHVCNMITIAGV